MERYRVWWKPQVPMKASFVVDEIYTLEEARRLEKALADYDLFQLENRIKPDYCNAGGVQEWDKDTLEWVDVEDDDDSTLA